MIDVDLLTSSYDYTLPKSQIAKYPVTPRDSAKLLIYNRADDTITHATFRDILEFLPPCDVVINDTRVIKARIFGKKESGGEVELLLNRPLIDSRFLVLIRGRVREGVILQFAMGLTAEVLKLNSDGSREVIFHRDGAVLEFPELVELLDEIGHIPLPPYMERSDIEEDSRDYQTIFAKHSGAVASPTASLHFTEELFSSLRSRHNIYSITLHIGAGTFQPVKSENILEHQMHSELFSIPRDSLELLKSDREILAVGTTVTRTVEYFIRTGISDGECNLFLNPTNRPERVNYLLTNFHLPKSTLIMLVSSFIGRERTLEIYREAVESGYRFFSYGDAMLII